MYKIRNAEQILRLKRSTERLAYRLSGVEEMNEKTKYEILKRREFLKGYGVSDIGAETTDQEQKLPCPLPLKAGKGTPGITLPLDFEEVVKEESLITLIKERKSCRAYAGEALRLCELSFLLWATQGIRYFAGENRGGGYKLWEAHGDSPAKAGGQPEVHKQISFRNVPSAGSRHPLETYLFISRVQGIRPGIYHYLPSSHELELWKNMPDYADELTEAFCGQRFAAAAPVAFVWSAVPYRTEWRYGQKSHKYILLDAGHVCENLYLACSAIGCGACAIGAYDQELLDELLDFPPGPSGEMDYECAVYAAAVGKRK